MTSENPNERRWRLPRWLRLPRRGGTAAPDEGRDADGESQARRKPRFQPTPLGLFGVMLAAMFVTLLLIQTFTGTFRAGDDPAPEERERSPDPVATPPEGTARIMVAGDSIVQGSSGDYTWRYRLWKHLDERSGADVVFVGPYDDMLDVNTSAGGNHDYADPDFDREHAGRWGASTGDVTERIGEQVAEFEPHYLLLMAGINDLAAGRSAQESLDNLVEAVVTARVAHGGLQIVLGEITPVWGTGRDEELNEQVAEFNRGLPALGEQLSGDGSPVVVAHSAEDYAPAEDNWDTTHPNPRGEQKIAAAFADALSERLSLGDLYPRPLPDVEVGPRGRTGISAEDDNGEVVLTWDPVPGATRYQVLQKRVRPLPDELVPLPADIDGTQEEAGIDNLLSGATYEFVIQPYKGDDGGLRSEPVEITVDDEPPDAPESVRIEDGGQTLAWSEVDEAGHYEIWRRPLDCEAHGNGDPECEPQDDLGPDGGEGWASSGIVEDDTEWAITADGGGGYELVVRSHRDFVEGEYSDPVVLEAGE
ncbi:SGNH/GDSL hydrolase family protein [Allosalinactinospora lopnorensis]|uniref:SGNH/GDSL hydrolase family protein n=1 Tax=Allosalinactinospora lopnorensis TaxID=1352348 RepID=UPI000A863481|nr:GDSL-type esterase/lipase family protein [Allosalinactinospora lopnorensis]